MQVLLLPERIKIQLIKITNKTNEEGVKAKPKENTKTTSNKSVEAKHDKHKAEAESYKETKHKSTPAEPHVKLEEKTNNSLPTLLNQVKDSNQTDVLFTKICKYLANPENHDRPNVYLCGSQAQNALLYKDNIGYPELAGVKKTMLLI